MNYTNNKIEITNEYETPYMKYYQIASNEYGFTHVLYNKKEDKCWLVHASIHQFPMKYGDSVIFGNIEFII